MSEQIPLPLTHGLARNTDPKTSKDAAASVDATKMEAQVLAALVRPMTTHELAEATGIDLWSLSPRLRPLADRSLVYDTGERRKTPRGRMAIVWDRAG